MSERPRRSFLIELEKGFTIYITGNKTRKGFKKVRIADPSVRGFLAMERNIDLKDSYDIWSIDAENLEEHQLRKLVGVRRAVFYTYVD